MRPSTLSRLGLVLLGLAVSAPAATAALVTYEFTADVIQINDDNNLLGATQIAVGDTITGRFSYDPSATVQVQDPTFGNVPDIGGTMEWTIQSADGPRTFSAPGGNTAQLFDGHNVFSDALLLTGSGTIFPADAAGTDSNSMQFVFQDSVSETWVDSLQLPQTIDLGDISAADFFTNGVTNPDIFQIISRIRSLEFVVTPGDECADAFAVASVPFSGEFETGSLLDGTAAGSCNPADIIANDGWFAWTPDTDVFATLDLQSVPAGTEVIGVVYEGSCGALTEIACDSAAPASLGWLAEQGVTYYIQFGVPAAAPPRGGTTISLSLTGTPRGDTCGDARRIYDIPFQSAYTPDNLNDGSFTGSCNSGTTIHNDVWYVWTAPSDGAASFSATTALTNGIEAAVFTGDCFGPLEEIDCDVMFPITTGGSVATLEWPAVKGETYRIQVGAPAPLTTTGTGTSVSVSLNVTGATPGETCDTAAPINGTTFTTSYNTLGFTDDGPPGSCNDPAATVMAADGWWAWTAPADGDATLAATTSFTTAGVIAAVYDGTCGALNELGCNSIAIARGEASVTVDFTVTSGTTYYLQVGLPDIPTPEQRGGSSLHVALTAELTPGDTCETPNPISADCFQTLYDLSVLTDGLGQSCFGPDTNLLNDGWYSWTAPANGTLDLTTILVGPNFGGINISVFSGDCQNLTLVACGGALFLRDIQAPTLNDIEVEEGVQYLLNIARLDESAPSPERINGSDEIFFDFQFTPAPVPCPEGTFQKLIAMDAQPVDNLGEAIDVHGNLLVVGAPNEDDNGNSAGAAYVFERDPETGEWTELCKLLASDGLGVDRFGFSVAVQGDYVAVGAPYKFGASTAEGAVYVFKRDPAPARTSFTEIKKLTADDPSQNGNFGWSLDFQDDILAIGSIGNIVNRGAIYIHRRDLGAPDNFGFAQKIVPGDVANGDQFGYDVALNADLLLAGSRRDAFAEPEEGSAYLFQLQDVPPQRGPGAQEYVQILKIPNPDPTASAHFGTAVDLTDDTAVIGARDDRLLAFQAGRAFVFERDLGGPDNWGFAMELAAPDFMALDKFGFDVAVEGDVAFIGAPVADYYAPAMPETGTPTTLDTGAVYVFTRDTGGPGAWGLLTKLHPLDPDQGDRYGHSLAIDMGTLAIGASSDNEGASDAGAAYVGPGGYADCNLNGILDICDILDGTSQDTDENLIPDECTLELCRGFNIFELDPEFPEEFAAHGFSSSIRGLQAVVGAPFAEAQDGPVESGGVTAAGLARVYELLPFTLTSGMEFIPFDWIQVTTLQSPQPGIFDAFGLDVDMEHDLAAVGAPFADNLILEQGGPGEEVGAAFVYRRPNIFDFISPINSIFVEWPLAGALFAEDGVAGDLFGWAVDIEKDYALVGAPGAAIEVPAETGLFPGTGAVYAFERFQILVPFPPLLFSDYFQVQKFDLGSPEAGTAFGAAIDISDSTAAIGAPGDEFALGLDLLDIPLELDVTRTTTAPGAAFVYERLPVEELGVPDFPTDFEWTQIAELIPGETHEFDAYGYAVAADGDFIAVGAPLFDPNFPDAARGTPVSGQGAVFVFHRDAGGPDNWGQVAMLQAFDAQGGDLFGLSVSISDDFLVVGAPGDDLTEDDLPQPDPDGESRGGPPNAGSIYVFQRGDEPADWTLKGKFIALAPILQNGLPGASDPELVGFGADIDGSIAVAGAPNSDFEELASNGFTRPSAGQAYAFHAIDDCQPNQSLDFCDIFFGDSLDDEPTDLVPDECQGTGACCLGDAFILFSNETGPGSGPPICLDDLSEAQCGLFAGTYLGDDTLCAGSSCLGACCIFGLTDSRGPLFEATVGFVDFDGTELRLTGYTNPTYTFAGTGLGTDAEQVSIAGSSADTSSFACWPMSRQVLGPNGNPMPSAIADDSVVPAEGRSLFEGDAQGFAGQSKSDGFFGVTNTDREVVVEFTFDISGFASLFVSADFAAMGNFENVDTDPLPLLRDSNPDDKFLFEYSVDGAPFQTLFNPRADEGPDGGPRPTQSYFMDNAANNPVVLNDPLVLNGSNLTDNFSQRSTSIPESGDSLTIRVTFDTDGSSEGFGFDNLRIGGIPDEPCVQVIEPECFLFGGTFQGVGAACEESTCAGACCLGVINLERGFGGECVESDALTCLSMEGAFFGAGTTCANVPCGGGVGACCLGFTTGGGDRTISCLETDQDTCENVEMGVFLGVGTDCLTAECVSLGACCFSCNEFDEPVTCTDVLTLEQCCAADGLWAGPMTSCASMPCTMQPVCQGDLDGDNDVDVFDFGVFAPNFGCTGGCVGDLDCDGDVDVFDFGIFAPSFGCTGPLPGFIQCGTPNPPTAQ